MIPVRRVREPADFDAKARKPGRSWLKANTGAKRPKDLWSPFRPALARGFKNLCGYAAMLDPTGGTVDHFLSWSNHPEVAYEWSNYRFASGTLKGAKRALDDAVLDPYEVKPGWFEILLPSLQLVATDKIPPAYRKKAELTIDRLGLRDGERVIEWRRSFLEQYDGGHLDIDVLRSWAPLLAAAVEKRDGKAPAHMASMPRRAKNASSTKPANKVTSAKRRTRSTRKTGRGA
jgi:hypothetical protein